MNIFVARPVMSKLVVPKPAYVVFVFLLFLVLLISTHVIDTSVSSHPNLIQGFILRQGGSTKSNATVFSQSRKYPLIQLEFPLNCTAARNETITCPRNYPTSFRVKDDTDRVTASCPDYYRWIHEDLRPWKATGITEAMVARARQTATFRLTIVDGRAYIEQYRKGFQSRATFNIWGILQLLRRYPGKIPDLDLIFDCEDRPVVFKETKYNETAPPPLFKYCADDRTLDIVFPDWSFWGWPELNIKPWDSLSKELEEANRRIKWTDREPYAYWKGNPHVCPARKDLMKCNVSKTQDWNARLHAQDWKKESQRGFKDSNLASECTHRYKIYIEGNAWSVSGKYILACDSVTFMVTQQYHDFFTRGLVPLHHYWPINEHSKCKSIKFAVDWGESHKEEAQQIGKSSTNFILEDLKMDYVYDYMFHLLNEYAKLLKFKPRVPDKAVEFCSETMACGLKGLMKDYMMETLEKGPAMRNPCAMPPPYDSQSIISMKKQMNDYIKKVETWENNDFKNQTDFRKAG